MEVKRNVKARFRRAWNRDHQVGITLDSGLSVLITSNSLDRAKSVAFESLDRYNSKRMRKEVN